MIKLHPPKLSRTTIKSVNNVLKTNWLSTSGKNINKLETKLGKINNTKYCCATINGTSALDLAIKSIKPNEDCEIITTSLSWISTVNAILYNDIKPIFLNIDNNFNLNLDDLEKFIINETYVRKNILYNKKTNKRIIAILYTNLYGNTLNIYKIKRILKKKGTKIFLIEDAAESLGANYPGTKLLSGSLADISCLSFNANKIITSSCGGALLTNNKKIYKFCSHKANQCKRNNFINDGLGYNYKITNLNATILLSELKYLKLKINKKKLIKEKYFNLLKKNKKIEILNYDLKSTNNWLINIKFKSKKNITKKIITYLKKKNIETRPIFVPFTNLHYLKKFQKYKTKYVNEIIKNCISIPSGPDLKNNEIKKVSSHILKFLNEEKN